MGIESPIIVIKLFTVIDWKRQVTRRRDIDVGCPLSKFRSSERPGLSIFTERHHLLTPASSAPGPAPQSRSILEGQLRECYGRVVYSHKTHEKCADILLSRLSRIKILQIVLSAITTAGFIGAVFGAGEIGAVLGLIVSTVLLALNSYTKNYDLGELAQKHKQAANDLWLIRENYLSLLVDIAMKERPLEALQEQRDKLVEQLHTVYRDVLQLCS